MRRIYFQPHKPRRTKLAENCLVWIICAPQRRRPVVQFVHTLTHFSFIKRNNKVFQNAASEMQTERGCSSLLTLARRRITRFSYITLWEGQHNSTWPLLPQFTVVSVVFPWSFHDQRGNDMLSSLSCLTGTGFDRGWGQGSCGPTQLAWWTCGEGQLQQCALYIVVTKMSSHLLAVANLLNSNPILLFLLIIPRSKGAGCVRSKREVQITAPLLRQRRAIRGTRNIYITKGSFLMYFIAQGWWWSLSTSKLYLYSQVIFPWTLSTSVK